MRRKFIKSIVSVESFTLLELLIASSVMAILFSIVIPTFFNMVRINNYHEITEVLFTETDYIAGKLTEEIYKNTLDWPEYYNYYVLNGGGEDFSNMPGEDTFGSNYTVYGSRFYNPGMDANDLSAQGVNYGGIINDDLGTWCQTDTGVASITSLDCNGLPSLEDTEDFATGTNPYESSFFSLPTRASAVCDSTTEMFTFSKRPCSFTNSTDEHEADMLFLISPDGNTKTMIGREPWYESTTQVEPSGYALSILKMTGTDTDNDGVNETWGCAEGFLCTAGASNYALSVNLDADDLTDRSSATGSVPDIFYDFVPITSPNVSITDLRFYIAPIEDPNKAFNEFPEQIHPSVELNISVESLDRRASVFSEKQRTVILSQSVETEFEGEINSYAP